MRFTPGYMHQGITVNIKFKIVKHDLCFCKITNFSSKKVVHTVESLKIAFCAKINFGNLIKK